MSDDVDRAPIVVIGLGNPMRSDDGVGPAVIERLSDLQHELVAPIVVDGEATRLLELWAGRALAVVVDAVISGAPPGTVHRADGPGHLGRRGRPASSHAAGIAEAVALGQVLDRMPDRLVVYGVEAGDVALGPALSPPVESALPRVVRQIRSEVGEAISATATAGTIRPRHRS